MSLYNPHAPDWHAEAPADITLEQYAKAWVDMEPHIGQLRDYAAQAKVIVEFGVRGAVSTWAMLDGLPPDGRLIGVDIKGDRRWLDEHQPDWTGYVLPLPRRVRDDPRFELRVGDSLKVPLPDHADLVMIDSSHEYEQTLGELVRAADMAPAVIALHDYYHPTAPGVRRAIEEFITADGRYQLATVHPSDYGLAVLRPA